MRRLLPLVVVLVVAVGCSTSKPGEKTAAPLPTKVVGSVPKQQTATVPSQYKGGDPTAGRKVFLTAGCTGCHTLKDAGATGTVGPNLDQVKPPLSLAVQRVTQGAGAMPSFKSQLSTKQIADVTAYVVTKTGGDLNG
ncbi:MAG TPA: c-type cytochrome [Gaiellaceae bacterium]|nr:c-type cytochrome [Gaiellaceae bacterium]